jgi:hypothetical protein
MPRSKSAYHRKILNKVLPLVIEARAAGMRTQDDILAYILEAHDTFVFEDKLHQMADGTVVYVQGRRLLSRSALYRALKILRNAGMDPGPQDRSTARKLGRPTKAKKTVSQVCPGTLSGDFD